MSIFYNKNLLSINFLYFLKIIQFKFILFEEVSENFLDLNISKHNGIE